MLAGCRSVLGIDDPVQCAAQAVATGNSFTCAVDGKGAVWCWGKNDYGQTQPTSPGGWTLAPAHVELPSPAVQVAAGVHFACARLADGTVWCWGSNEEGELGLGSTAAQGAPVQVQLGEDRAIDLDAGSWHACVRRELDRGVVCWGASRHNDLGYTMTDWTVSPPTVVPGTGGAQALTLGHSLGCTLDDAGTMACWGQNKFGQLAADLTMASSPSLLPVAGLAPAKAFGAAGRATCAVTQTGDVTCWGDGADGELGRGDFTASNTPGPVAVANATEVHVTNFGACALLAGGKVACWGNTDNGDGSLDVSASSRLASVTGATALAMKYYHSCAIANGQVECWGDNSDGALGRGSRAVQTVPVAVSLPLSATVFSVGSSACASDGRDLYCWGGRLLGNGTPNRAGSPVIVPTGLTTIDGLARGCAWGGGMGQCWGDNSYGQLGTGAITGAQLAPVTVKLNGITQIAPGVSFACAIAGGSVYCWGRNHVGQLGTGTSSTTASPVPAPASTTGTIVKVVAGNSHACALDSAGKVLCWGAGGSGQLGDGTMTTRAAPTAPTFGAATPVIKDIVASRAQMWALTTTGEVYAWGSNNTGQLGVGNMDNQPAPVMLSMPHADALGDSCAHTINFGWYCWGDNTYGQLADGNTASAMVPVAITTLDSATQVRRSDYAGCALGGGTVSCWGLEPIVGDGDLTSSTPVPVTIPCN